MEQALAERARTGEDRQRMLEVILGVLADESIPDEVVGGLLRDRPGRQNLADAQADVWADLPRDHGRLRALAASYPYLRQFRPDVLAAIDFHGGPGMGQLMEAVSVLRELNRSGRRKVPQDAPTGFVPRRYAGYLARARRDGDDAGCRHYWELCTLLGLRDGLRSGDVFVPGSRCYADPGSYLIAPARSRPCRAVARGWSRRYWREGKGESCTGRSQKGALGRVVVVAGLPRVKSSRRAYSHRPSRPGARPDRRDRRETSR